MVSPNWQSILDGLIAGDRANWHPALDTVGLIPRAYADGVAELTWTPGAGWANPMQQSIFGGAAASALEMAYGFAMATLIEDDEMQAGIRLETDYVRPALLGQTYSVTAKVTERAGSMMFCHGQITDHQGATIVLGSGVCRILRPR